jgi:hypothetical protein
MNPILQNILAVIAGIIVGSIVNMGIISLSGTIIPPPAGADVTTAEGLTASMHLFEPRHFIMPFLAHAIGTFFGAWVAAAFGAHNKMKLAIVVGVFFLLGGIASAFMLPAPLWFIMVDLIGAYIPMAYLAGGLVRPRKAVL